MPIGPAARTATRSVPLTGLACPCVQVLQRRYFRDATWMVAVPRRLKELHRSVARAAKELANE
jgi:RNA polymerase sigma-B factor